MNISLLSETSNRVEGVLQTSAQTNILPQLMPIGIFWDIENCQVPFNRSAIKLVERIRRLVVDEKYRESEFQVVCDISKANKQVIDDLNSSQVTVIHISCTAKNAADDKIKQLINRFIETNGYNSAVVLISDDINFGCVLSDLKYHLKVEVILIQRQATAALINSANSVFDFKQLCEDLPLRSNQDKESVVMISNLPIDRKPIDLKKLLSKLSSNCGGKKINLNLLKGEAIIRFSCFSDAKRAQQRIDKELIFGKPLKATLESSDTITDSSDTNEEVNQTEEMGINYRFRNNSSPTRDNHLNELLSFCNIHSNKQFGLNNNDLPMVNISLPVLAKRIHRLLDSHGGSVPLKSFLDCYTKEFYEMFNTNDKPLIALEHLISCVPGVCISIAPSTLVKRITWIPNRDIFHTEDSSSEPTAYRTSNQSFGTQIQHFSKEVRELLKSLPHSTVAFNKFVPSYHNHFVRQLCVGHYGFYKLSELLEEIPHIIQIYGENDGRMITLTHREQTKRFANDLIKVLKSQNGRRIKLSEFPMAYKLLFDKVFEISDYGVCYLEDILRDVWEGTVIITPFGSNDKWIELPKRDRSPDQKRRTLFFSQELYELLNKSKEVIDFELTFSKFIPCYHRYFNKQCRVSDYGFTKLVELLEELSPKVIEIVSDEKYGEKCLKLSYENRLKALIFRFESILKSFGNQSTSLSNLELEYQRRYKSKIDYIEYYANDLIDLIDKMPNNKFRLIQTKTDMKILLLDSNHFRVTAKRVTRILMEETEAELSICQLEIRYLEEFGQNLDTHILSGDFSYVFICESKKVRLTQMFLFCRECILCMQCSPKRKLTVEELDKLMIRRFDKPLPQPTFFKCKSICELMSKFFEFFNIEKRKTNVKPICIISLDQQFVRKPLVVKQKVIQILKRKPIIEVKDLMDSDNPELLPLPDLVPNHTNHCLDDKDLIYWSSDSSSNKSHSPDLMTFIEESDPICSTDVKEIGNCLDMGIANDLGPQLNEQTTEKSKKSKKSRIVANFS